MTKRTPARGAWVRDKHPKPKEPVDPAKLLLPALLYISGTSRPKVQNHNSASRKKKSQHPQLIEVIKEIPPPPSHHEVEYEYIQPPIHHRAVAPESVCSYERQTQRVVEPYKSKISRESVYLPKPRASARPSPEAARLQLAMDRMAGRTSSGTNSRSSGTWSSALIPLEM